MSYRKSYKVISSVVLVTFTSFCLQPLTAAAQLPSFAKPAPKAASAPPAGADEQYAQKLEDLKEQTQRAKGKRKEGKPAKDEVKTMRSHKKDLEALEADVDASFDTQQQSLMARNLPQAILDRHTQAKADFKARQREFKSVLKNLEDADDKDDDNERDGSLDTIDGFFKKYQQGKTHTPVDPNKLPFRVADDKVRPPATDGKSFALVAGKALATLKALPAAPTSADLAETEDVQITQPIKDLAVSLNNNPVKIYNWVHNNIEFLPTYGSIQGSDMTLQAKRGNAFDTASLLIALYRAAGIPSRYAYGTIEVPVDQAMNWVGGVTKADAAISLLGQGGIPNIAVVAGGTIRSIKMEHVWVEAYVDHYPSRGAVNRSPDTWVPVDASFKQYTYTQGMNIKVNVPFDVQGFMNQAQQGATINQAEGWVQSLNQANIQTTLTNYQNQVKTYIDATKPSATVGDVVGAKTIQQQNYSILLGTLPYKTLLVGNRYSQLPDTMRHKLEFRFYASQLDKNLDSPSFAFVRSLPGLVGKKVALTYDPTTAADQAVIDNATTNNQTSFPAYLVHVTPTLKIEGAAVASGDSTTVGDKQILTVNVVTPWYSRDSDYKITAGGLSVLGVNSAGITSEQFNTRVTQHDLSSGNDPDFTAEMFHQIIAGWWAQKFAYNDLIGTVNQVISYQMPSHALVGAPVTVRYFFGIARSANYKSRFMDAKEDTVTAAHQEADNEKRRQCLLAFGYTGSYLEGGIYDQAFLLNPGISISAITALKAANEQAIRIYSINQSNLNSVLPLLQTDSDTLQDISNAVAAGKRVTTPQRDMQVAGFSGIGYLIEDVETGAAAYMISGGRNGGSSPAGESVFALPQIPSMPLIGFIARGALRSAGASLVAQGGVITGIAFPALQSAGVAVGGAAAGAAAAVLGAILIILILLTAFIVYVETKYPRQFLRFRHYTSAAIAIFATKQIIQTEGGTFGNGVYVADAIDEEARGVGCPPGPDVITRFQIPNPVTGYVEFAITRANFYFIDSGINSVGQREFIVREPLMPSINPRTLRPTRALYIGEYAFGLQVTDVCF